MDTPDHIPPPSPEPSPHIIVAIAAQVRFAGYARLYAALALLGPGLALLATPLRNTETRKYWPAGDMIIYGDDGAVLLILALAVFVAVLVAGAFNPVRAGVGSAAAACGLVLAGITALATVPEENLLSAGGWAILLIGLACAAVGATHEIHLHLARRRGLGV